RLSRNELNIKITDSVTKWEKLKVLRLDNNKTTSRIPKSVKHWLKSRLDTVIHDNELDIDPTDDRATFTSEFPNIQLNGENSTFENGRMVRMFLANSNLVGKIPSALGTLVNMTDLDLNNNKLDGTIPDELWNLINLKTVTIDQEFDVEKMGSGIETRNMLLTRASEQTVFTDAVATPTVATPHDQKMSRFYGILNRYESEDDPAASQTSMIIQSETERYLSSINSIFSQSKEELSHVITDETQWTASITALLDLIDFFSHHYAHFQTNLIDAALLADTCIDISTTIVSSKSTSQSHQDISELTVILREVLTYLQRTFANDNDTAVTSNKGSPTWKSSRDVKAVKTIKVRLENYNECLLAMALTVDFVIKTRGKEITKATTGRMEEWVSQVAGFIETKEFNIEKQVDEMESDSKQTMVVNAYLQYQQELLELKKQMELRNLVLDTGRLEALEQKLRLQMTSVTSSSVLSKISAWMLPMDSCTWMETAENRLGSGGFASVYKGKFHGKKVAVKVFDMKGISWEKVTQGIAKEVDSWQRVSGHPNVVTLLGCCTTGKNYIVMELCDKGNVRDYLADLRYLPDKTRWREALLRVLHEISLGIQELHANSIIHRDLKGANILIRNDGSVAIADFGLGRQIVSTRSRHTMQVEKASSSAGGIAGAGAGAGTLNWMSPEQLTQSSEKLTKAGDIWSFGMVMYELLFDKDPHWDYMDVSFRLKHWDDESRMEIPTQEHVMKGHTVIWDLVNECARKDPKTRPKISEIVERLKNVQIDESMSE
ncbi:hypothetical protein HDU76_001156, partial [Blyttiomyces sp. JEL0837]